MTKFDIFHITFNEANQEENWLRVLELHPTAKRIHGILGIDKAHMACNALSTTEHFWTIDGDNWLTETLDWEPDPVRDLLWFYALDPVLNIRVKNGGVKLWRQDCFINTDMSQGDFSVAATAAKISPDKVLSITRYNTIPYDAWKTSFRHCVKLLSRIFRDRPLAVNVEKYLDIWKSYQHLDDGTNNAIWCYRGYLDAEQYVKLCNDDLDLLYKINDYKWLIAHFNSRQHE
jgi:hypothetical protein